MILTTLIKRFVFPIGTAFLLLLVASVSANAITVHLCAGGSYSITTIEVVPGPNGTFRHVSKTTRVGTCTGNWSYTEHLVLAPRGNMIQVFEEKGQASLGNTQVNQLPLASPAVQTILASWRAGTPKRPLPTKEVFLTDEEALREMERLQKLPRLRIVIPLSSLTMPRGVPVNKITISNE